MKAQWRGEPFGTLPDGRRSGLHTAALANGFSVTVSDLGASLVALRCAGRNGALDDVILGCADAAAHWRQPSYLGAAVGRVAGRIRGASFVLDGRRHDLPANEGLNHLHGGHFGFTRHLWDAEVESNSDGTLRFHLVSAAGDEGYPGTLATTLSYRIEPPARLTLCFEARCDAPTPFNPTSHGYFNLNGHASGSIDDHRLWLRAARYTPVDGAKIPTGAICDVAGTPFDFTRAAPVGDRSGMPQGYDHNFIIDEYDGGLAKAAVLHSPRSGRRMTLFTDRPCVHLYTGGSIGRFEGKDGATYGPFAGLCLETQGYPDALNQPAFPDGILRPGQVFRSRTVLDLDVDLADR